MGSLWPRPVLPLDRLVELLLRGDAIAPVLGARVGADYEQQEEVAADEREDGEQHPRADQYFPIQVRADLEGIRRGRDRGDVVRRRLLDRLAGRVVLLDDLRPGLLARLHGLLVEDEVAEEREEADEHEDAERREDEVQVELHLLGDLEDLGVPDVCLTIDHVERVRVDDERAARVGDVE